ncbi:MAG TPA: hypothetical protein VF898_12355 [Chloroflexota bacterium]
MSTEDRARILRMVADGVISADDAADLLDAVEPQHGENRTAFDAPAFAGTARQPDFAARPINRNLVIYVEESGKSKVNLRIPLGLTRAAGRFIPRSIRQRLEDFDIDLGELLGSAGPSNKGSLLHIEDGDTRVQISVE